MEILIKKVAIGTTKKTFEWVIFTKLEVYTKYGQSCLSIQFTISVMKRKFENQKHKA